MSFTHRFFYFSFFPRVIARSDSDVAIFDMLIADLSIEDCHATLAMTGF